MDFQATHSVVGFPMQSPWRKLVARAVSDTMQPHDSVSPERKEDNRMVLSPPQSHRQRHHDR
jgi:hypothetical protein